MNERAVAGETTPELHTTLGTEHPRNLFFLPLSWGRD